ncbi:MAG: hypothetical protein RIS76_122 [Verrucomicrobiota bacterium]|jgi:hypothetical protein
MDPQSRLRHEHSDDFAAASRHGMVSQNGPLEFLHPEDLLRHDRSRTVPPAAIAQRLAASIDQDPTLIQSRQPWWKRLLGRGAP